MIKENIVVLDLEKYEELKKYEEVVNNEAVILNCLYSDSISLMKPSHALARLDSLNSQLIKDNKVLREKYETLKEQNTTFISRFKRFFKKE